MVRKAKNATEMLVAAKWILENIGWTQGAVSHLNSKNEITGFCSMGALGMVEATEYGFTMNHAYSLLSGQMDCHIITYNDKPGRTKQEIINAFDRAIQKSKKRKS